MSNSKDLVQVALNELNINQKQLAAKLAVSNGQISRWKNHGDYMSLDLEDKLTKLCQLGAIPASLVLFTGSIENAKTWDKVIRECAQNAEANNESGYYCPALTEFDEWAMLENITDVLQELGVQFPKDLPDLIIEYFNHDDLDDDKWGQFFQIPIVKLICSIFCAFTDITGFHYAFIEELSDHDDLLELTMDIQSDYLNLAACKVDFDQDLAPNASLFKLKWKRYFDEKLTELKSAAVKAQVPLRAELLDLASQDISIISKESERQAFGFNDARLHPDIYMNELLVGMRVIHQVLPAIMKKLGLEEEFELDTSELSA